jgi:hypothetical protein
MENTKLAELRRAYEMDVIAGRYSTAEQTCWRALEICGFRGPQRKFSYWLTTARLKVPTNVEEKPLWQWAYALADTYYELGRYIDAEPIYTSLLVVWMSSQPSSKGQSPKPERLLPDLLRKLAGAEAFIGKERRAGKHWKLAQRLSGRFRNVSLIKGDKVNSMLRPIASNRLGARTTMSRGGTGTSWFSRSGSSVGRRRFRRNR